MSPEEHLQLLNEQYITSMLAGDVKWYRERLADEFVCIDYDGSLLDKAAFIRKIAHGSELAEYQLGDVDVRIYGDVALVRAKGAWTGKDGIPGVSRYIDVYVRSGDEWKVVSAQVTRPRRFSTRT